VNGDERAGGFDAACQDEKPSAFGTEYLGGDYILFFYLNLVL